MDWGFGGWGLREKGLTILKSTSKVHDFRYLIHNGSYSPTTLTPHRQDWLVTCGDILVFTAFCVQVMM